MQSTKRCNKFKKSQMKQFFAVEKQNGSIIEYFYTFQEAINYVNYLDKWGYWDLNIREVN